MLRAGRLAEAGRAGAGVGTWWDICGRASLFGGNNYLYLEGTEYFIVTVTFLSSSLHSGIDAIKPIFNSHECKMPWKSISYIFFNRELKMWVETRIQYSGFFLYSGVAYFMARIYLDFILCHFAQLHKGNFLPTSQMNIVQGGCFSLILQTRWKHKKQLCPQKKKEFKVTEMKCSTRYKQE